MPKVRNAPAVDTPQVVINTTLPPQAEETPEKKEKPNFWNYIAQLSPAEWNHHTIYLYRTKPLTGMKAKERYLDVFAQPFTVDDIRKRFGGEEFRAMLVRENKIVANEEFAIEAPPKYDMTREVPLGNTAAQTAASDAVTQKVVDQFLGERRGENDMFGEAHRKSLDILADGYRQAVAAVAEAPKPNGGTNSDDLFKALILKMLDRNPMKEMMEALAFAREMGLIPKAGEAVSSVTALSQLKDVVSIVKDLGGEMGMGGGRRSGGIAEVIMDKAPELIEKGVEALGKYAEIKQRDNEALQIKANAATSIAAINRGAPPPAQPQIPTAMPSGIPQPQITPVAPSINSGRNAGAGGLDLEPIAPGAPPVGTGITAEEVVHAENILYNFLRGRVVQLIALGRDGAEVVEFVENYDENTFKLLENANPEALEKFFSEDPILRTAMALPRWPQFFAEACADLYEETVAAEGRKPN
jgi:hypothetical protein